ncbi:MAG: hypothetical protein KF864_05220 [Phycisphaeraceae bacterium]|nr:hypothetical protein [Phycisphaeraceae bacterium]
MLNAMSLYEWFGWGLVALGGGLALWGLLRDRARGRARCPGCWYSMEAHAARLPATCPECGRVAKRATSLYRTRRRWGVISVGAAVMVLGNVLFAVPRVQEYGAVGAVPTVLLGWVAPIRPQEVRERPGVVRRSGVMADIEWQIFRRQEDGRVDAMGAWSWALGTRAWGVWDRWRGRSYVRVLDCGPAARACGVTLDEVQAVWINDDLNISSDMAEWFCNGGLKGGLGRVGRFVAYEVTEEEWGRIREVDDVLRSRMPVEGVLLDPAMSADMARVLSLDDVMVTLEREPRTLAEMKVVVEAVTGMRVRVLSDEILEASLSIEPGMLPAGKAVSVVRLLYAGVTGAMAETKPVWTVRGDEVLIGPVREVPRGMMVIDIDVYRGWYGAYVEARDHFFEQHQVSPIRESYSELEELMGRWWFESLMGVGEQFGYGVQDGHPRGVVLIGRRMILRGTACDFAEVEREIVRATSKGDGG